MKADRISAALTLYQGSTYVKSWSKSGNGTVIISQTATVQKGKSYTLVLSYSVNGQAQPQSSVKATCPNEKIADIAISGQKSEEVENFYKKYISPEYLKDFSAKYGVYYHILFSVSGAESAVSKAEAAIYYDHADVITTVDIEQDGKTVSTHTLVSYIQLDKGGKITFFNPVDGYTEMVTELIG